MSFTYGVDGMVDGYECRHGNRSEACTEIVHPGLPDLCARVAQEMLRWYAALPDQSRVRLGKVEYMRYAEVPNGHDYDPHRPNLQRLAGL